MGAREERQEQVLKIKKVTIEELTKYFDCIKAVLNGNGEKTYDELLAKVNISDEMQERYLKALKLALECYIRYDKANDKDTEVDSLVEYIVKQNIGLDTEDFIFMALDRPISPAPSIPNDTEQVRLPTIIPPQMNLTQASEYIDSLADENRISAMQAINPDILAQYQEKTQHEFERMIRSTNLVHAKIIKGNENSTIAEINNMMLNLLISREAKLKRKQQNIQAMHYVYKHVEEKPAKKKMTQAENIKNQLQDNEKIKKQRQLMDEFIKDLAKVNRFINPTRDDTKVILYKMLKVSVRTNRLKEFINWLAKQFQKYCTNNKNIKSGKEIREKYKNLTITIDDVDKIKKALGEKKDNRRQDALEKLDKIKNTSSRK